MDAEYEALDGKQKLIYWGRKAGLYYPWLYSRVKAMWIKDKIASTQFPIDILTLSRIIHATPRFFARRLSKMRGERVNMRSTIEREEAELIAEESKFSLWANPSYFPELQPYIDLVIAKNNLENLSSAAEKMAAEEAALHELKSYFGGLSLKELGAIYQNGENEELTEQELQVVKLIINQRLQKRKA